MQRPIAGYGHLLGALYLRQAQGLYCYGHRAAIDQGVQAAAKGGLHGGAHMRGIHKVRSLLAAAYDLTQGIPEGDAIVVVAAVIAAFQDQIGPYGRPTIRSQGQLEVVIAKQGRHWREVLQHGDRKITSHCISREILHHRGHGCGAYGEEIARCWIVYNGGDAAVIGNLQGGVGIQSGTLGGLQNDLCGGAAARRQNGGFCVFYFYLKRTGRYIALGIFQGVNNGSGAHRKELRSRPSAAQRQDTALGLGTPIGSLVIYPQAAFAAVVCKIHMGPFKACATQT